MGRRITVWERDPVIAEDITEIIYRAMGDADVTRTVSLAEAATHMEGERGGGTIAILHGTQAELCDSTLHAALASATARVIAIHQPLHCAAARNWIFVPPPFTEAALRGALWRAAAFPD